jgi:hypothetical protein
LDLEICAVNVTLNKKDICVLSYYNPPQIELSLKVFVILKNTNTNFILMGDLNSKLTLWEAEKNNPNGDVFQEILLNYDCLILNNKNQLIFVLMEIVSKFWITVLFQAIFTTFLNHLRH